MKISSVMYDTVADGPGRRTSIYFSGCNHGCKGCHNADLSNPDIGMHYTKVLPNILKNMKSIGSTRLTLSGGDPLYDPSELLEALKMIKEAGFVNSIWLYTGYTYEEVLSDPIKKECLKYVNVLVDGKYEEDNRDVRLMYRGSSNQRLIDASKSTDNEIIEVSFKGGCI